MPKEIQLGRPSRSMRAMQRFMPKFTPIHTRLYRLSRGRLGTTRMTLGAPVLLLTTTGRRSGEERSVPIGHMEIDGEIVVAGTNGGLEPTPAWVLNLRSDRRCLVQIRGDRFEARAEFVGLDEYESLWNRLSESYPTYNQAQSWIAREIPLIRLRRIDQRSRR
ncbi:MAG: nitroreductase/quinone reductase family protein [Acidimicrobiia bacterium]